MKLVARLTVGGIALTLLALALSTGSRAGEKGRPMLKVGDQAPSFQGPLGSVCKVRVAR